MDELLIMSVNPGFGGQAFIPHSIDKIRQARALVGSRPIPIEVDGGVSAANARALVEAGVSILVAGSAIFSEPDPAAAVRALRAAALRQAQGAPDSGTGAANG